MTKAYVVNEVFYSLQGEGMRAGEASVFVRFTGCNMRCAQEAGPKSPGGFDCDTEFESGTRYTLQELGAEVRRVLDDAGWGKQMTKMTPAVVPWIVFTGGEPALQVDAEMCAFFRNQGHRLAIETNGSVLLSNDGSPTNGRSLEAVLQSFPFDWITVSPKVAEHAIRQLWAHEVKYVRGAGQAIPKTAVRALHQLISPATNGLCIDRAAVLHCVALCKTNPDWRMSVQLHKDWMVR